MKKREENMIEKGAGLSLLYRNVRLFRANWKSNRHAAGFATTKTSENFRASMGDPFSLGSRAIRICFSFIGKLIGNAPLERDHRPIAKCISVLFQRTAMN